MGENLMLAFSQICWHSPEDRFVKSQIQQNVQEIERKPGTHEDHHNSDQEVGRLLCSVVLGGWCSWCDSVPPRGQCSWCSCSSVSPGHSSSGLGHSSQLDSFIWHGMSEHHISTEFLQIMSSPELAPEWERWKLPVNPNVSQEEDCWRHQELNTKNRDAVVQPRQDIGKYFQTFLDKRMIYFSFSWNFESIIKWMRMFFLWYL